MAIPIRSEAAYQLADMLSALPSPSFGAHALLTLICLTLDSYPYPPDPGLLPAPPFQHSKSRGDGKGGRVVLTTINRTVKAYLLAVLGAEYIARIIPRGE